MSLFGATRAQPKPASASGSSPLSLSTSLAHAVKKEAITTGAGSPNSVCGGAEEKDGASVRRGHGSDKGE